MRSRTGRTRVAIVGAGLALVLSTFAVAGANVGLAPAPIASPELDFWFGQEGSAQGQIGVVSGLDFGAGRIAVSDNGNDVVHIYQDSGLFLHDLGGPGAGPGQFSIPRGVAIASNGRVYVVDAGHDRVSVFGSGGVHKFDFGSTGSAPGLFDSPRDVVVMGGRIYVADYNNFRIQVFDLNGGFIDSISDPGVKVWRPDALAETPDGHIAVRSGDAGQGFAVIDTDGALQLEFAPPCCGSDVMVDALGRFWFQGPMATTIVASDGVEIGTWDVATFNVTIDAQGRPVIGTFESPVRIEVYKFYECDNKLATYVGTPGDDAKFGTDLDDVAVLRGGDDAFLGGFGNDTVCGGPGDDTIDGGPGKDRVFGQGGVDYLLGSAGNDFLWGGGGVDEIDGGQGRDRLYGGGGFDVIFGGAGADWLYGGNNADELRAGNGNDHLFGGNGPDECFGGAGTDTAASCASEAGIP